jgi:hypothetical protein
MRAFLRRFFDGADAVLGAALEPGAELLDGGGQDEDRDHVGTGLFVELEGALIVDVEEDVVAGGELFFDLGTRRAVEIAVHFGGLEQAAIAAHLLEGWHIDEVVMLAVDLVGAARAGSD